MISCRQCWCSPDTFRPLPDCVPTIEPWRPKFHSSSDTGGPGRQKPAAIRADQALAASDARPAADPAAAPDQQRTMSRIESSPMTS